MAGGLGHVQQNPSKTQNQFNVQPGKLENCLPLLLWLSGCHCEPGQQSKDLTKEIQWYIIVFIKGKQDIFPNFLIVYMNYWK